MGSCGNLRSVPGGRFGPGFGTPAVQCPVVRLLCLVPCLPLMLQQAIWAPPASRASPRAVLAALQGTALSTRRAHNVRLGRQSPPSHPSSPGPYLYAFVSKYMRLALFGVMLRDAECSLLLASETVPRYKFAYTRGLLHLTDVVECLWFSPGCVRCQTLHWSCCTGPQHPLLHADPRLPATRASPLRGLRRLTFPKRAANSCHSLYGRCFNMVLLSQWALRWAQMIACRSIHNV